jgi:hypothetical protein
MTSHVVGLYGLAYPDAEPYYVEWTETQELLHNVTLVNGRLTETASQLLSGVTGLDIPPAASRENQRKRKELRASEVLVDVATLPEPEDKESRDWYLWQYGLLVKQGYGTDEADRRAILVQAPFLHKRRKRTKR